MMNMHDAARNGYLWRVRQLIEAGVSVDSLNKEGRTPLHMAVLHDQYQVVALLINSKCNMNLKDHHCHTPLHLAVLRGRYEVVALLINGKCNMNLKDRRGRTPVMLAADLYKKDIVELLLHCGAGINCIDDNGRSLLHRASYKYGWTDIACRILYKGEVDINAVTKSGETPLLIATIRKNEKVAALLIQAGADVNISNVRKLTPLHCAAYRSHTRVIQTLLEEKGLDLSPQDDSGDTPLHLACQMYRRDNPFSREAINQLLDAGADTNMKNNQGETALSVGIRQSRLTIEVIRLFVQKGAFLENCDYSHISCDPFLKNILKDGELCTRSIVNKFNRQSLPALNSITYFAGRLPNVNNFQLGARQIDEVENLVKCEIERNTFCNVVKVHPIALSALCVLSLITCQSGKKRAASPDFGHSLLKKNCN